MSVLTAVTSRPVRCPFFFSSRRRRTASYGDWSSDVCSSDLNKARARIRSKALANVTLAEGRAEAVPASADSFDAVLASLSLMYVIDRAAAANEIARILRPEIGRASCRERVWRSVVAGSRTAE